MSDVLKISLIFLLILWLLRKKLNIGYVMLIASVVLALFYLMDISSISGAVWRAATGIVTVKLLFALSFIRIFEQILREQNVLSSMMEAVRGFFRNRRIVIISMPMLIGMLPSLGGAYFSAPMVKEATTGLKMSSEEKAFINYWFRHPWEYILPLYPGLLLASAISKVPLSAFIAANLGCALVLLATGFIYSMRGVVSEGEAPGAESGKHLKKHGRSFVPLLAVLILVMGLQVELHYALPAVILPLIFYYRLSGSYIMKALKHGFSAEVFILILGIMLFKETMEASGAVRNLSSFFVGQGVPVFPVLCLLPFGTGLLTGHTVGFVGSTFPLLISITGTVTTADMSLAFVAGFLGVLLSPVHLCLVLTREYFGADLWGVYKKIIPSGAFIFLAATAQYLLLR